jgi:MoxR-like ATPase
MELHEMFLKLITEYDSELKDARKTENFKRPLGNLVRRDIVEKIKASIKNENYKIKGSVGSGRWTDVPWVAIFDKRITTTAQKGVYIVYLVNKDTKELYLTLNQGATDVAQGEKENTKISFTGIATSKNGKTAENLEKKASEIRNKLGFFVDLKYNSVNTGSKPYDAGCIYYKKYTVDSLKDDDALLADLEKFIKVYQTYFDKVFSASKKDDKKEKREDMADKNIIDNIAYYIESKGFKYDTELLANFYLCLKSKPFVLLAGTSGTGKTRMARLFAEAIGAFDNGRYLQVAVKPDWSDSTDLFGHVNLDNKFIPGAIVEFIKKAENDPELPYILCLDEMNLARVEYYFSDFLSVMETRDWSEEGKIKTDKLIPKSCYVGDKEAEKLYSNLIIPENLYIIGTVNMDETTFPFSKKVLDRANTIEFSIVDLELADPKDEEVDIINLNNDFLRADYLNLRNDCSDRWETVLTLNKKVSSINDILKKYDAHFGYRMRDEIIFYMLYNEKMELLSEKQAFDNQIMQKILPRIQGSSEQIATILKELFKICAGPYVSKNGQSDSKKMENYLAEGGSADYPKSAQKICSMLRRYEDDDFTSFWV